MVININVNDSNLGDRVSAPCLYFPGMERRDVFGPVENCGTLIVGGGGMFHGGIITEDVARWSKRANRVIGWGIGSNNESGAALARPGSELFHLLGCRDKDAALWVPCVSCLSPLFDSVDRTPRMETALYLHKDAMRAIPHPQAAPCLTNAADNFATVLQFLASAAQVVTNSYHGIYWATLLGKPVLAYAECGHPTSKFHGIKHAPRFLAPGEDWRGIQDAPLYPQALAECRAANLAFAERVGF